MQSAVTNGAASRAHRILDAAISAGLAPEGNLAIAERGKGRRNRPYKCGSTAVSSWRLVVSLLYLDRHGARMRDSRVGDAGNAEKENRADFVSAWEIESLANPAHTLEGMYGKSAPACAKSVRLRKQIKVA